ncbi:MAG TPA: UvrD-helicase domain-containing protein, partial [Myxococcales bacterium]|nr:UvrD-helicase domain-containing protein [Myxococcales bacterium]
MGLDLSLLNPQQKKAVLQTEGPLLVLAGAGSGKTRVIAHRVVHLIEKGIHPRNILAVTFTNKAAAEMKERIVKIAKDAGLPSRGITVSTFHAFGVRIVRGEHERLGLPEKFAIMDSGDQSALVKRLLRDLKIDDKRFDTFRLLGVISRLRTTGVKGHEDDEYELAAQELLPKYELGLRTMGAVDFDDLLLLPLVLFREHPEILQNYQKRYRYLLVDEYQDTNDAQLQLLEMLSGLRRNLCVVGDDDQSIYAWRGAQVRHILDFDKKFPGAVEVYLEQNYRSSGNILDAANAVIGKNPGRKSKRLWTDKGGGPNIRLVCAPTDEMEAKHVADEAVRISYEEKIPPREMAVLYRTNAQARPLEEALRLAGVRYRVVGGTSLFDRKEVRDLLAYLRAALNPRDEVSLLRIVNVPARGIGDTTVAKAQETARALRCSVWDIFKDAPPEQAAERITQFVQIMQKYGPRLSQPGFSAAARELCDEVALFDEARRGAQSLPAQARKIEAMESLLRQLVEYEKREEQKHAEKAMLRAAPPEPAAAPPEAAAAPPELATAAPEPAIGEGQPAAEEDDSDEAFAAGLPGYLARLALDSKEADGDAGDAVTLMTLHGAKGLEWRCVFLCGMEEGLLPHSGRGFDDSSGEPKADGAVNLEEERRLCYVGMTRARERLILTRAVERTKRGKAIPRTPSRFLEDVPENLLDVIDLSGPQAEAPKAVQEQKAKNFFAAMSSMLGEQPPDGKGPAG